MNQRKNSTKWILIAGIAAAILAGAVAVQGQLYMNRNVEVVFAAEDPIYPNTIITENNIVMKELPQAIVDSQLLFEKKEDVIGGVALSTILPNTLIMKTQVFNASDGGVLSDKLSTLEQPELMAYTIPANASNAVGGAIRAGDFVNIFGNFEVASDSSEQSGRVVKILIQNARVIEVVGSGDRIRGLTFALTAEEILDVEFALRAGSISFALLPLGTTYEDSEDLLINRDMFLQRHDLR